MMLNKIDGVPTRKKDLTEMKSTLIYKHHTIRDSEILMFYFTQIPGIEKGLNTFFRFV